MSDIQSRVSAVNPSLLATNAVLRNTYFLLSLTLLFSAGVSVLAMITNAPPLNIIVSIVLMYGLMFLTVYLRNSGWGLVSIFAFTGFMGYLIGPMLNAYIHEFSNGPQLVALAAGTTGLIFFALSGYVLITRKNLSFLSGFIMAGVITALVLMVASIFIHTTALQLAISALFVLLSSGIILYRTSAILHGFERNYIMATIDLYLALFNLFISLLNILGAFAGNRNN